MTLAAAKEAVALLEEARASEELTMNVREIEWLARISESLEALPSDEGRIISLMQERYGHLFSHESYGL